MKHLIKFNENDESDIQWNRISSNIQYKDKPTTDKSDVPTPTGFGINDDTLLSMIEDHIFNEVYLRDVPYSMQDGAQELDPESVKDAANAIIKMLKEKGIL